MVWSFGTGTPYMSSDSSLVKNSNTVRIVTDPEVKMEIELDDMHMNSVRDYDSAYKENSVQMRITGVEYPIIRIKNYIMRSSDIQFMEVNINGFMPTITLSLVFPDTIFANKENPKDGDIVSLFMRTSTGAIQYIRCDFLITNCNIDMDKGDGAITALITGSLFIPGFDATRNNTIGYIGTSKEAIKEIAKKFHTGFAFNDFDNTDDMQNWISCNDTMETFIRNIYMHAWKDETSFFTSWIDLYYNICYINVNKSLLTSSNPEEVDLTFISTVANMINVTDSSQDGKNAGAFLQMLSNSSKFKGTPFYIKEWKFKNESSSVSLRTGYKIESYTFVHNQNIVNDLDTCMQKLDNVPAFDPDKVEDYMTCRGRVSYDASSALDTDQKTADHDYINTYIKKKYCGVQYMTNTDESNFDTNNEWYGNVHKNYLRAAEHNNININELKKMWITVKCEGLNLQVMKGDRVPVCIFYDNIADNLINDNHPGGTGTTAIRQYSGYYIVMGVKYKYKRTFNGISPFETEFILSRREWPTPDIIAKKEN